MNTVAKFENSSVKILIKDGKPLFELYTVGAAIGYVRIAKGKTYPRKDRIDKVLKFGDINTVVHGGQPYLAENQVYEFMIEAKTEKCKAFRKWLTSEVLPSINHTGKYENPQQPEQLTLETSEYHYFDKAFSGQPVISLDDFEHFTGIAKYKAYTTLTRQGKIGKDYFHLDGVALADFKNQNPSFPKASVRWFIVITKAGFEKIMKIMGQKSEVPKLFSSVPELEIAAQNAVGTDECIAALNVLRWLKRHSEKCKSKYDDKNQDSMSKRYLDDCNALTKSIKLVGMKIACGD